VVDEASEAESPETDRGRDPTGPDDPFPESFPHLGEPRSWQLEHGAETVRLSVVMPFFNAERYIEEAIRSVLAQTYQDWELLLIDDGSADHSAVIARGFADQYPERIRYLMHPGRANRGANASRNLGIAHARGEYVAMHDADDVSERRRLEKQVSFLDAHPEVALLGAHYTVIDGQGTHLGRMKLPCSWVDLRWELLFSTPFAHSSVILRKEAVVRTAGGYDERLRSAQDYEFWWRIVPYLPAANLRQYLVRYRVHPHSISKTYESARDEFRRIRLEHLFRLLAWDRDDEERNEQRRAAMTSLVFGWETEFDAATLQGAVEDLLRLQRAFSAEAGLEEPEWLKHRSKLRSQVARNLVAVADAPRFRGSPEAGTLLRIAFRLNWPTLFRPRTLVRCCTVLFSMPAAALRSQLRSGASATDV
jgi:glycosyltransferase involved in cell wall biosynthesis